MELFEIKDLNMLKQLLLREDIYKQLYDVKEFSDDLVNTQASYFVLVHDKQKIIGLIFFTRESSHALTFHGGIFKEYRGKSTEIVNDILNQVHELLPEYKIWTKVPKANKKVNMLLKSIGCKQFGYLKDATASGDLIFYRWN